MDFCLEHFGGAVLEAASPMADRCVKLVGLPDHDCFTADLPLRCPVVQIVASVVVPWCGVEDFLLLQSECLEGCWQQSETCTE